MAGLATLAKRISDAETSVGELSATIRSQPWNQLLDSKIKQVEELIRETAASIPKDTVSKKELADKVVEVEKALRQIRDLVISSATHGGNANRDIKVNGTYVLTPFTDINLIAGSNTTLSAIPNQTTKYTDLTISTTGGGGSVVGIPSIGGAITGGRDMDVLFTHPTSVLAQDDNFQWDTGTQQLRVGSAPTEWSGINQVVADFSANLNNFVAVNMRNKSSGDTASSDFFAAADNDGLSFTGHFVDFGINSSGYLGATVGAVKTISLNAGGTGYTAGDTLTISAGDSNATVNILTVNGGGTILTISLALAGTGYSVVNAISTSGGTGSGGKINVLSLIDTTLLGANDGYSYVSGGNYLLGIDGGVTGKAIKVFVDGLGIANEVARFTSSVLTLGNTGSVAGQIYFQGKTSGTTLVQAPSVAGVYTLVLPPTKGTSNQVLTTDGNGITTWTTPGASSVASGITRVSSVITANTTGGSTSLTDYVYITTAGISFTLPAAGSSTNLYTLKNASNSSVLVTAIGGNTMDGSGSVLVAINNQSLDFLSDGTNYRII